MCILQNFACLLITIWIFAYRCHSLIEPFSKELLIVGAGKERCFTTKHIISIFPLWTFCLYVATFQQHLPIEYISQLIRYSKACAMSCQDLLLTMNLLNQGVLLVKFESSLRKFYGLHHTWFGVPLRNNSVSDSLSILYCPKTWQYVTIDYIPVYIPFVLVTIPFLGLNLSSFMIYHLSFNISNTTDTSHRWSSFSFRDTVTDFTPDFSEDLVGWSLVFSVMFCPSLFVFLSFFVWSLIVLSVILRISTSPYHLVSSNFSCIGGDIIIFLCQK
jgi:hypothetical protein